MVALLFTASAVLYLGYTWLIYSESLKDSRWVSWAALVAVMIVYGLWIELAKRVATPEKLFFYGLCWDAVVLVASIIIPLTMFEVKPTLLSMVGFLLFVAGILIFKLGAQS